MTYDNGIAVILRLSCGSLKLRSHKLNVLKMVDKGAVFQGQQACFFASAAATDEEAVLLSTNTLKFPLWASSLRPSMAARITLISEVAAEPR